MKKKVQPIGRPSSYTEELGDEILDRHSNGETLADICRDSRMPSVRTVFRWAAGLPQFASKYAAARLLFADAIFDAALSIADNGASPAPAKERPANPIETKAAVARDRLRVDTRLRIVSKINPGKYGERLALHHSGGISLEGVDDATINRRIEKRLYDLGVIDFLKSVALTDDQIAAFLGIFRVIELPTAPEPIRLLPGETDFSAV